MPATAERHQASADVPSQGPSVFFDPSALDLLRGDATVLTRFLQFVSQDAAEEHIFASKIEIRGSADPEDNTSQILVRVWMQGSDSEIRQYHHDLGGRADRWAAQLPEAYKQYFHAHLSFQIRREANV